MNSSISRLLSLGGIALAIPLQAQIPVTGTTPVVENFQTVTTTALPSGWKVSPAGAGASATWSNPANSTSAGSVQSAYNVIPQPGSVVWQPVAGYSQPVHRSIGVYSSAAYPSPNAIMAQFQNKLASSLITSCTLSYVPGRRITRTDSQPFTGTSFELFYSTDGTTWTPLPSGNQTNGWNSFYQSAVPGVSSSIGSQTLSATITGVQIPINGSIYFRWQINTLAAGVHWGFSLDDVTFQVTGTAPAQMHWLGDDTTRGGAGTWTATGGSAWSTSDLDGSPGSAWEPARTAQFGGNEPSSVAVSGTVPANLGILFLQSGTLLTGDTILLAGASRAANTLSAADSVTVIIDCDLAGTSGLTKAGDGSLILNRPLSYSGGTDILSGSVIVAGLGTFTGGIGALGSGDVSISSGASLLLSNARAIDNAAKLTLTNGARLDLGFAYGIEEAVGSLVLNGVPQANGTYGASGSGAENINDTFFSGTGLLRVGTPPPVPTSLHWVGNDANRGGEGIWSATESSSWALIDADIPGTVWDATKTAVFGGGEPATVTVVGELAANRGLHFRANASTVEGDPIFLGGATPEDNRITVEDNVATSLECGLTGAAGLTKDGPGMLVFSSPVAYAGGTFIAGGSLAASSNGTLGAGDVTVTPSSTADSWLILENNQALPDNATVRLTSSTSFAGKLNLGFAAGSEERVDALFLNGIAQDPGSYGAAGSGADFVNNAFFSGAGRLRVGEPPAPQPSFFTWAASLGLNPSPDQDSDADGLSNALEYILGTDPKIWNLNPVSYRVGPNQELILSFPRSDAAETPDVAMEVHASPDLKAWPLTFQVASTSISTDSQVTIAENGNADDLVTVVIPNPGQTRLYGCLCVTIHAVNN
jgi:autotransporter-associated beta strand protein